MLSRKHYVAIASEFKTAYEDVADDGAAVVMADFARRLAGVFAGDNPAFDRERFLKACGVEQ